METNASSSTKALEKKEPQPETDAKRPMESTSDSLQELRVKVAELCGAKWGFPVFGHDLKWHTHFAFQPFEFDSRWAGRPPAFEKCVKEIDIPDYPNDLNACAELIENLQGYGWTCVMGNEYGWVVHFRRFRNGIGYKYTGTDNQLPVAICKAFSAVMEGTK